MYELMNITKVIRGGLPQPVTTDEAFLAKLQRNGTTAIQNRT